MHISESQSLIEIIHSSQSEKNIIIGPGVNFTYGVILRDDAKLDITIEGQVDSKSIIKILCIGQSDHIIHSNIITKLVGNHAQANVYILSLLKEGSNLNVHGNITLAPNVFKVSGHLLEENLILGKHIKLKTAPILDVRSSDVSASHGCRVERLDPKRLFYMQSRGLKPSESQSLIIDGYLNQFFEGFDDIDHLKSDIKTLLS